MPFHIYQLKVLNTELNFFLSFLKPECKGKTNYCGVQGVRVEEGDVPAHPDSRDQHARAGDGLTPAIRTLSQINE